MKVLDTAGFSLATADSVELFNGESFAGEVRTVTVMAGGLLCIAAPGGPMSPELQNVATEVVVFIERINPRTQADKLKAPTPLADPLVDKNIQPGTAVTFEVQSRPVCSDTGCTRP